MRRTNTGRIVYKRKRHPFRMSDVLRITIAVSNLGLGSLLQWRTIWYIAESNLESRGFFEPPPLRTDPDREQLNRFIEGFEVVVSAAKKLRAVVPGPTGWFLDATIKIWEYVRAWVYTKGRN